VTTIDQITRPAPFDAVAVDLYRDIHKGIRAELFDLTGRAGRTDASDRAAKAAVAAHLDRVVGVLVTHAEHEDFGVQPALETHFPAFAEQIASEHAHLEGRLEGLRELAAEAVDAPRDDRRQTMHRCYIELASFTSAYLAHQDVEERVVMPALDRAIGAEAVLELHGAIIASIPPAQMAESLAFMIPAMNIDDRLELLGGIRAGVPAEVFAGIWGLVASVLDPADHTALAARLGIAA
jgi:Hemerythrin HHE cation binding domain